jgi:hypothetical protein
MGRFTSTELADLFSRKKKKFEKKNPFASNG